MSLGTVLHKGAVIFGFLILLWLTISVSVAGITRQQSPAAALRVFPFDAIAMSELADNAQAGNRSDTSGFSERLALAALLRDPTAAMAARVLGMAADLRGDRQRAAQLMIYSDRMSKRDLDTQLWLVYYELGRGNIQEALRHFNAAASTSPSALKGLFPILLSTLEGQAMVKPVAEMLVRDEPYWMPSFLKAAAQRVSSTDNVAALFAEMARRGRPPRADIAQIAVDRLLEEGKTEAAAQLGVLTLDARPVAEAR